MGDCVYGTNVADKSDKFNLGSLRCKLEACNEKGGCCARNRN